MGSSSSKAARTAGSVARRYPSRVPPSTTEAPRISSSNRQTQVPAAGDKASAGPTVRPEPMASEMRNEAINLDASDPDFARSLRSLGAVQPTPAVSNTSFAHGSPNAPYQPRGPDPRANPAIALLENRERFQQEAEREFIEAGRRGHEGRRFLDVSMIRQVLMLRDEKGVEAAEIERRLGLKKGIVAKLGERGGVIGGV